MEYTKKRECLKCGKRFKSTGIGNRICQTCSVVNEKTRGPQAVPSPGHVNSFGELSNFEVRKVGDV